MSCYGNVRLETDNSIDNTGNSTGSDTDNTDIVSTGGTGNSESLLSSIGSLLSSSRLRVFNGWPAVPTQKSSLPRGTVLHATGSGIKISYE